jgi:hypothetical protein
MPMILMILARATKMQECCAYIVGPDGHIISRKGLSCTNEDEAKECAVRLVDGHILHSDYTGAHRCTKKARGNGGAD